MPAKCGLHVVVSDMLGVEGTTVLDGLKQPRPYAARVASLRRVIDSLDVEVDVFAHSI